LRKRYDLRFRGRSLCGFDDVEHSDRVRGRDRWRCAVTQPWNGELVEAPVVSLLRPDRPDISSCAEEPPVGLGVFTESRHIRPAACTEDGFLNVRIALRIRGARAEHTHAHSCLRS